MIAMEFVSLKKINSLFKRIGKIEKTEKEFLSNHFKGNTCIAHNRWATTGIVSEENAHPHCDCKEEFLLFIMASLKIIKS